jgi:hypothetical protein
MSLSAKSYQPSAIRYQQFYSTEREGLDILATSLWRRQKVEWNGQEMKCTNCDEAAQYVKPEFSKG